MSGGRGWGHVGGRIFQLNVSQGGVPKRPVLEARLGSLGLEGDAVAHPRIHGGPERALCLYSLERILALQAEGHTPVPGSLGENVTLVGVDFDALGPGDRLRLGEEAVVEVTRYTTPCKTIAPFFRDGEIDRIHQERRPGWSRVYARVVAPGVLRAGARVALAPRATADSDGAAPSFNDLAKNGE